MQYFEESKEGDESSHFELRDFGRNSSDNNFSVAGFINNSMIRFEGGGEEGTMKKDSSSMYNQLALVSASSLSNKFDIEPNSSSRQRLNKSINLDSSLSQSQKLHQISEPQLNSSQENGYIKYTPIQFEQNQLNLLQMEPNFNYNSCSSPPPLLLTDLCNESPFQNKQMNFNNNNQIFSQKITRVELPNQSIYQDYGYPNMFLQNNQLSDNFHSSYISQDNSIQQTYYLNQEVHYVSDGSAGYNSSNPVARGSQMNMAYSYGHGHDTTASREVQQIGQEVIPCSVKFQTEQEYVEPKTILVISAPDSQSFEKALCNMVIQSIMSENNHSESQQQKEVELALEQMKKKLENKVVVLEEKEFTKEQINGNTANSAEELSVPQILKKSQEKEVLETSCVEISPMVEYEKQKKRKKSFKEKKRILQEKILKKRLMLQKLEQKLLQKEMKQKKKAIRKTTHNRMVGKSKVVKEDDPIEETKQPKEDQRNHQQSQHKNVYKNFGKELLRYMYMKQKSCTELSKQEFTDLLHILTGGNSDRETRQTLPIQKKEFLQVYWLLGPAQNLLNENKRRKKSLVDGRFTYKKDISFNCITEEEEAILPTDSSEMKQKKYFRHVCWEFYSSWAFQYVMTSRKLFKKEIHIKCIPSFLFGILCPESLDVFRPIRELAKFK